MDKKFLEKAVKENGGGVAAYLDKDAHEEMNTEELQQAVFESRTPKDASAAEMMTSSNRRNTLLRKAGFDWFDIDDVKPHPDNVYTIDEESVKNLAALIYTTKNTTPLVLRATDDGIQIIDGERRWRAHQLLTAQYGDVWRMVPGRCYKKGEVSDEEAQYILHAENMGQRAMTPSERALGFQAIAERIVEQRKNDPALKGKKTKTILAEQFGVSERTVMNELSISRNLQDAGKQLLDEGKITKSQAAAIAKLSEADQENIIEATSEHKLEHKEVDLLLENMRQSALDAEDIKETARTIVQQTHASDYYLKKAQRSLRKALRAPEQVVDLALLGQIKELVRRIEQSQE